MIARALPRLAALAVALLAAGTAQGEGISGDEKLREELGMLYGNVNVSEQRPTGSQLSRMGVLAKDLVAKEAAFESSLKDHVALDRELDKRQLQPIRPMTEEEWQKKTAL
jgi:hypothetical protein